MFNIKQIVSKEEVKKVFNTLISTKQKIKSNEFIDSQMEFGRNENIQITSSLYLTSSNKKKNLQKHLKIMFKKINQW
jgi:hypothetical protein